MVLSLLQICSRLEKMRLIYVLTLLALLTRSELLFRRNSSLPFSSTLVAELFQYERSWVILYLQGKCLRIGLSEISVGIELSKLGTHEAEIQE